MTWQDGAWGQVEWVKEPYLKLHVGNGQSPGIPGFKVELILTLNCFHPAPVALNYGASAFEGLKSFRHPDGHCRIFRPDMNAKRLAVSRNVAAVSVTGG